MWTTTLSHILKFTHVYRTYVGLKCEHLDKDMVKRMGVLLFSTHTFIVPVLLKIHIIHTHIHEWIFFPITHKHTNISWKLSVIYSCMCHGWKCFMGHRIVYFLCFPLPLPPLPFSYVFLTHRRTTTRPKRKHLFLVYEKRNSPLYAKKFH